MVFGKLDMVPHWYLREEEDWDPYVLEMENSLIMEGKVSRSDRPEVIT